MAIEYRLTENQIERLSALATELVRRQVAAIAGPITSALVAKAATTTIPIVFVAGKDGGFFFANRPTHSSWAARRFSDASNNDLTTHTAHLKEAAEVGQEVQ